MNVVLVCPYDLGRPGGVQAQVVGLAGVLEAAGHRARIVGHGPGADRSVGRIRPVRINGSVAPLVVGGWDDDLVAGADVVHVHEPLTPLGWRAIGVPGPTVATFHADVPRMFRRAVRVVAPVVRRRLAAATVTAVSPVSAVTWEAIGVRCTVVPNGVTPDGAPDVTRSPTTVVFVGRDEPRKGLDVLLAAWPRVLAHRPDAELVVVGATRDHPHPGVRWLGTTSEASKWTALRSAAVACAPNLGGESFGIVVVEAMAAGCAVVASDIPAFRAVAGDAAVYVPPGEADALAGALRALLDDPHEVARLSSGGVARAVDYSWDRVLSGYLAAYHSAGR